MPSPLVQAFVETWLKEFLASFKAQSGADISDEGLPTESALGDSGLVGLEQPLDQIPGGAFWIGLTEEQAEDAGSLVVKEGETSARESLFAVLRGSIDAAARTVAAKFNLGNAQEIALKTFTPAEAKQFTPVRFSTSGIQFEIYVGVSPQLHQKVSPQGIETGGVTATSGTALDGLFDYELPVSFSFGRKKLPLKDVLKLGPSSVVELDRAPDDLVEVIVNDSVIAWGEVVAIDGQYGIRIRRIASGGLRTQAMNEAPAPSRALVEA